MKTCRLIQIVFLLGLLSSCDPENCTITTIENNTKGSLEIVLYSTSQGELKTKLLSAESKDQVDISSKCGLVIFADVFPQDLGIDSIKFEFPGILMITFTEGMSGKNPFNHDDWIQSSDRRFPLGKILSNTFEISEEDLNAWQ